MLLTIKRVLGANLGLTEEFCEYVLTLVDRGILEGEKQMYGIIDCEDCIYAVHSSTTSGYSCTNKLALKCVNQIDKYDCIFYDGISEDYISDMDKVRDNT